MKLKAHLCFAIVALTFFVIGNQGVEGFDLEGALAGVLMEKLKDLWRSGDVEFLGHQCFFDRTPNFYRWELHHKSRFYCPGIGRFTGRANTVSPTGSMKDAITDYAKKALSRGIFTREQLQHWIE